MATTTKTIRKSSEGSLVLANKVQTAEGWKRSKLKKLAPKKPLTKIVSGPKIVTTKPKPVKVVVKSKAAAKRVSTKPKAAVKPKKKK